MSTDIRPFVLDVPQADLDDLNHRLDLTRWPEREAVDDWSQGVPLARLQMLCAYWRNQYDWRRVERRLNALGQYKTSIDGLDIHFLHVRSRHDGARPLVLTHGWPGSIIEFLDVVAPLTDPERHGGDAGDAFHLVIPSLPGYGFSDRPSRTGWGVDRIADAWGVLMRRLGYERWYAQGGDWGASVTYAIGKSVKGCIGAHLNMCITTPEQHAMPDLDAQEEAAVASIRRYYQSDAAYAMQQATRPQTVGYGLADSPAMQAAWIYEKYASWTDNAGEAEDALSTDQMLDNIMLYWLPNAGTSAGRLYWESIGKLGELRVNVPLGISVFPKEFWRASRRWMAQQADTIAYYNEVDKGGHFAAWEQPALFVSEVRACFRAIEQTAGH